MLAKDIVLFVGPNFEKSNCDPKFESSYNKRSHDFGLDKTDWRDYRPVGAEFERKDLPTTLNNLKME